MTMTNSSKTRTKIASSDCVLAQPVEGEFILQLVPAAKRGGRGNVQFRLFWFDPKTPAEGGPIDHTRAQVYMANPEATIRQLHQDGARSVRVTHGKPTWLAR